jgi:N-methylhydantoinase A
MLEAKGCDANRFVLVPFGGAGPVHAWRIAEAVGIPRLLVPPAPGIGCAMGLLQTDIVHVYMQSAITRIDDADADELEAVFERLTERARRDTELEGFSEDEVRIERQLDIRYPHQGYELALDCAPGRLTPAALGDLRAAFDERHAEVYGVSAPDELVEIVNLRVRSVVPRRSQDVVATTNGAAAGATAAPTGERDVYFESHEGFLRTAIYDRGDLHPGMALQGPAIVEQLDSTTVIGPGWSGTVDELGNLRLDRENARQS